MAQKVIRYDHRLEAKTVLEPLITEEWEAIEGKGFENLTSSGHIIRVFPDGLKVIVYGENDQALSDVESNIRGLIDTGGIPERNLSPFIDPEDCVCSRAHISRLAEQINECYASKSYDAVSVLMRRMIETLLIECFESLNIANTIRDQNGAYFMLRDLIVAAEQANQQQVFRLTNKCREALPLIKEIGDQSAHSRTYIARKRDVDDLRYRFNIAMTNLKDIANLN